MDKTDPTRSQDGDGRNAAATNGQHFRIGTAGNAMHYPSEAMVGSLDGKMAYLAVYEGRVLSPGEINMLEMQLPIKLP